MPYLVNDPHHWQERAKEARALAESFRDSLARNQMVEIAAAYERMAECAEHHPIQAARSPAY